jgi:cyclase
MEQKQPKRIIPNIFVSDGSIKFTDTKKILDYRSALELALKYESDGADEVIFMDVTIASERRRNLPRFLKDAASTIQIPFFFGGGIHTITDVEDVIRYGAKKIYVNSAAIRNPELVNRVSKKHGSESLLVAIDTKKNFGHWKVYLNGGKSRTEIDLLNWAKMVEIRGAGEIMISTVIRGYNDKSDVDEILSKIKQNSLVPVLASIGISEEVDFELLIKATNVDGIVSSNYFQQEGHSISRLKILINSETSNAPEPESNG